MAGPPLIEFSSNRNQATSNEVGSYCVLEQGEPIHTVGEGPRCGAGHRVSCKGSSYRTQMVSKFKPQPTAAYGATLAWVQDISVSAIMLSYH